MIKCQLRGGIIEEIKSGAKAAVGVVKEESSSSDGEQRENDSDDRG